MNAAAIAKTATGRAWSALELAVDHDHQMIDRLDSALSYERKHRPSVQYAKAIIVEYVLAGFTNRTAAAGLFGLSQGCGLAYMLGAHLAHRERFTTELRAKLQASVDAEIAARTERIATLPAGTR